MKITEGQLRDIVRNVLEEAISRQDSRLANRFIKQDNRGGYTIRPASDSNVFNMINRSLGGRKDANGQFDIARSANDIYSLIQKYNAEIKKLTTVYNYLNARKDGNYVPKQHTSRNPMSPEQKNRMLASRLANKQERDTIRQQYGDIDNPLYSVNAGARNTTSLPKAQQRMRGYRNDVANKGNQGWLGSNLEEAFNWFNRKNQPDEIDTICQNYRKLPVDQMATAAEKVSQRIQEYTSVVQKLQGMLDKWQQRGKLVDKNAQARAERDAALKNVGKKSYNSFVAECVDRAIKKVLSA